MQKEDVSLHISGTQELGLYLLTHQMQTVFYYAIHTERLTDTQRVEPCFYRGLTGLKALEGRRGVSLSRDHYQQLLYIHTVAASSVCPFDLFCFFVVFFCLFFRALHKIFLKDSRAWWPDK